MVDEHGDGTLLTIRGQAELGGFFKLKEGLAGKQAEKKPACDLVVSFHTEWRHTP